MDHSFFSSSRQHLKYRWIKLEKNVIITKWLKNGQKRWSNYNFPSSQTMEENATVHGCEICTVHCFAMGPKTFRIGLKIDGARILKSGEMRTEYTSVWRGPLKFFQCFKPFCSHYATMTFLSSWIYPYFQCW